MSQQTTLTPDQQVQVARLKTYFPSRIAFGAVHPETQEFQCGAALNMRRPNRLAREGWKVFVVATTATTDK